MDADEWLIRLVPEDAAEGSVLMKPVPRKPWSCGECGQRNHAEYMECVMCGRDRQDSEA